MRLPNFIGGPFRACPGNAITSDSIAVFSQGKMRNRTGQVRLAGVSARELTGDGRAARWPLAGGHCGGRRRLFLHKTHKLLASQTLRRPDGLRARSLAR